MISLIVVALLAVLILRALGIPIYLVLMGVASILLVAEGRMNVQTFPAYLNPIVVLGGIYGGFLTLTEAAVLGVLCALIAGLFVYRSARLPDIPKMPTEAVDRTLVIILTVMGMFLEGVAIILIVLPVVFVVVRQLGIDMTHFAIVMVINIELALLSPPIGLNLFVMSNVTGRPVREVLHGTIPFFPIMLCLLMLVTCVPALSTFGTWRVTR